MGARAIGVQIQKLLLDLIFHIAARTVKPFIALGGREAFRRIALETFPRQVGDRLGGISGGFAGRFSSPIPLPEMHSESTSDSPPPMCRKATFYPVAGCF